MKQKLFLCLSLFMLCFGACRQSGKKESTYLRPASIDYSGQDTTEILNLTNKFVTFLTQHDFDGAVDMLYQYKDNKAQPFVGSQRDSVVNGISSIPIYDCKLNRIILRDNVNNEIALLVKLVPVGDIEDGIGVSKFFLNPVLVDGKWYLTLLDTNAEGFHKSYE